MADTRSIGLVDSISLNLSPDDQLDIEFTIYKQIDSTFKAHFNITIINSPSNKQVFHLKLGDFPTLDSAYTRVLAIQRGFGKMGARVISH